MHRPENTAQSREPRAWEHNVGARGSSSGARERSIEARAPRAQHRQEAMGRAHSEARGRNECTVSDTNIHHIAKRHVIGLTRSAFKYLNSAMQSVPGLSHSVDLTGSA